ncbi:MAG TPA: type II toxin-antitoxin system VapC family toxin [Stellaceae bacterium]|nr:type II toxin-antitoxin system VapC family toxin [Stellaceae bacterium]
MILLDTNVISELIRPAPDAAVREFLRGQSPQELFTCTVCEAEIRYGLARMPAGRRRHDLTARIVAFLTDAFSGRIVPFDSACAAYYGEIRAVREAAGRPITGEDAMIAATARAHGAVLATRNLTDFVETGIAVINPWMPAGRS